MGFTSIKSKVYEITATKLTVIESMNDISNSSLYRLVIGIRFC